MIGLYPCISCTSRLVSLYIRGAQLYSMPGSTIYSLFGTPLNTQHFSHSVTHILIPVLYPHLRTRTKKNNAVSILIVRLAIVTPSVCRSGVSNITTDTITVRTLAIESCKNRMELVQLSRSSLITYKTVKQLRRSGDLMFHHKLAFKYVEP